MQFFETLTNEINKALLNLFQELHENNNFSKPEKVLIESIQYSVLNGGKRFRPIFGVICAEACQAKIKQENLIKTLLSIELIHAYSLIHDDLPEMDNDTLRRGQPTVWQKFDPATALLAGDTLHALAFENLAQNAPEFCLRKLINLLAKSSGYNGICGGQMQDIFPKATEAEILTTHDKKTGHLILTAAQFGTLLSRANFEQSADITKFAKNLGLAFQIRDDLQDNDGISQIWSTEKSKSFLKKLGAECFAIADKFQSQNLLDITDFVINY